MHSKSNSFSPQAFFLHPAFLCSVIAVFLGFFAIELACQYADHQIWDDSYMFVRYADHFLSNGRLSWNPGQEPAYGLTSPLYLILVVPVRMMLPTNPLMTMLISSTIGGMLLLALLIYLLMRHTDASPIPRLFWPILLLTVLSFNVWTFISHFVSGMDTTFSLTTLAGYIILAKSFERAPTRARTLILGLAGGLMFFVRPDLLLFSYLSLLALILLSPVHRRQALLALALTIAATAACIAFSAWYFHSPLPLSFFQKGLLHYEASIYIRHAKVPYKEGFSFAEAYWPFIVFNGADLLFNFRRWLKDGSAVEKGLLAAAILFGIYYLFFVIQIMPFNQRFYYPLVPPLVFLGVQSAIRLGNRIQESLPAQWDPRRFGAAFAFVLIAVVAFPLAKVLIHAVMVLPKANTSRLTLAGDFHARHSKYWYRLDRLAELPDDFTFASSEVGVPGAMYPRKTLIDLAGLNETEFARRGFTTSYLLGKLNPDLIYLPHPDYKEQIAAIVSDADFKKNYDYLPSEAIGAGMGVAINRHGRYYSKLRSIFNTSSLSSLQR